jgi:hypothetical protein
MGPGAQLEQVTVHLDGHPDIVEVAVRLARAGQPLAAALAVRHCVVGLCLVTDLDVRPQATGALKRVAIARDGSGWTAITTQQAASLQQSLSARIRQVRASCARVRCEALSARAGGQHDETAISSLVDLVTLNTLRTVLHVLLEVGISAARALLARAGAKGDLRHLLGLAQQGAVEAGPLAQASNALDKLWVPHRFSVLQIGLTRTAFRRPSTRAL